MEVHLVHRYPRKEPILITCTQNLQKRSNTGYGPLTETFRDSSTKAYQALRLNLCTPHHLWPRRRRYNYQCRENQPVSRTGSCKKFQLRSYERSNNSTRFQWHCKFSQKFGLASCHMKRQARPHNARGVLPNNDIERLQIHKKTKIKAN